ncbi:MAG: molybdopterin cofactor-binding domain-containing protein [Dokdonella sp.]
MRRIDVLHDVGDSLVEAIDRGQIEGGFVQGTGLAGIPRRTALGCAAIAHRRAEHLQDPDHRRGAEDASSCIVASVPTAQVIYGSKAASASRR